MAAPRPTRSTSGDRWGSTVSPPVPVLVPTPLTAVLFTVTKGRVKLSPNDPDTFFCFRDRESDPERVEDEVGMGFRLFNRCTVSRHWSTNRDRSLVTSVSREDSTRRCGDANE